MKLFLSDGHNGYTETTLQAGDLVVFYMKYGHIAFQRGIMPLTMQYRVHDRVSYNDKHSLDGGCDSPFTNTNRHGIILLIASLAGLRYRRLETRDPTVVVCMLEE